jgi:STE24 endopeptidase
MSSWPLVFSTELTVLFAAALAAETAVRLWLASRQIAAVCAHRERVPDLFAGAIGLAEQRRAADYTAARARLGRWATVFEALLKLALTLGGGLAACAAWVDHLHWPEPWQGTALVLAVTGLLQLLGLPFALWRTFRIEARFGFNRMTPALFAVDLLKRLVLGVAIGAPLILATLALMQMAGALWWVWAWLIWLA